MAKKLYSEVLKWGDGFCFTFSWCLFQLGPVLPIGLVRLSLQQTGTHRVNCRYKMSLIKVRQQFTY